MDLTVENLKNIKEKWETVCSYAALSDNLDILKYAHENGFPLKEDTFTCAIENGNLKIINYLIENFCPGTDKCTNVKM